MIHYVLVNIVDKENFEKTYQLPYGCANADIYSRAEDAIRLLNQMSHTKKKDYVIEKWVAGNFFEVVVKGEWLI